MIQQIKISVLSIDIQDDDLIYFSIELANGISSTSLNFYGYPDEFKELGNKLITFPKTISDSVVYEIGEDSERWAYYVLLKIYCFEPNGHSAIQIKADNHHKAPFGSKAEFFITAMPASLNKLGQTLSEWNPKIKKEIEWIAE